MDFTSDSISPFFAYGRRVNQYVGFLRVVPRLGVFIPCLISMEGGTGEICHTLISISLNSDMLVDNHNLNVAISLLLARVDGPTHIFGCVEITSELDVDSDSNNSDLPVYQKTLNSFLRSGSRSLNILATTTSFVPPWNGRASP